MSISKGAFGQSGKGSFIESAMGARGWSGLDLIVGGLTSPGSTANLFRLNPADGSVIWSRNLTGTVRNIKQSPSGRIFVNTDLATDKVYEIDREDGSTITTSLNVAGAALDVDQNTKVYARRLSDLDVVRLLASDLTTVEANCNTGSALSVSVDGSGNIYCANDVGASTLLERYDSTGTAAGTCATNGSSYAVFSPAGDYVYCVQPSSGIGLLLHKIDKASLSILATLNMSVAGGGGSIQSQSWATDGTHIYYCADLNPFAVRSFVMKVRISDFSEVTRWNSSTDAVPRSLNGVTKRGSSYIVVGQRSQNWDGNDGTFKNVWSLTSSFGVNWSADIGTNFTGIACSASFVER